MKQITTGLFTFEGLLAGRVYMTEDADGGVTIIDTGLKRSFEKIVNQLASHGRQPSDIKRIIITHSHYDHVGSLAALQQVSGAKVIASFVERPYIEGKLPQVVPPKESLRGISRLMAMQPPPVNGVPVDQDVADGDVIAQTLGGLRVVFTPGHSPGHMSLWQPDMRVLITGDVIMRLPPRGLSLPFAAYTPDMAENRRSVKRIAELEPQIICFGHGKPMTTDAAAQLKAFAAKC